MAPLARDTTNWQIGSWTVQPSLNLIVGPEGSYRTTPKALATLLCLAEHQGQVVSRDTLLETVWAGTIVSDDTLNRAISDLRGIFKDTPHNSQVIETIRRRGYRLLLPASPIPLAPPAPLSLAPSLPTSAQTQRRRWVPSLGLASVLLLLGLFGFTLVQMNNEAFTPAYRPVPLTTDPGFEFDVALSHDGEQVAFAATSGMGAQIDLYVKQIGVETPQQLTNDSRVEISPGWAPDGRALAFLGAEIPGGQCGLYVMKLPGGDARKMADCKTFLVTGVSWSPDGKTIAFSDRASRDEPFRIYLLDVETRTVTALTDPPKGLFGDFSATFSPDGTSIGFIRGTVAGTTALILVPALGDVYTRRLDTGEETRLTFDNQEIPHIDWTPDGQHLVFASHRERGTPGLWKVATTGGEPTWLFGDNTFVRKPMLARHTQRLVFEQWDNEASIWQIDLDSLALGSEHATPLIHSTRFDATPQYSPDGRRMAFTSQRSGAYEIWVSDADGQQPLQLTTFGGPYTATPRWSPDGTQLTFETRTDGQSDIYVIDLIGGSPRRLTHHPAQDMVPSWSPDGKWIYFGSNRDGTWQVWKMPSAGGTTTAVTTGGGFLALATPSDQHPMLYYTRIDAPGLYRMPLEGGQEELVLSSLFDDDWGNWLPTETGLYFLQRRPSRLSFYTYATGEVLDLGPLKRIPAGTVGLSLSPDQKTLAFAQQRFDSADLWMIDDFE